MEGESGLRRRRDHQGEKKNEQNVPLGGEDVSHQKKKRRANTPSGLGHVLNNILETSNRKKAEELTAYDFIDIDRGGQMYHTRARSKIPSH